MADLSPKASTPEKKRSFGAAPLSEASTTWSPAESLTSSTWRADTSPASDIVRPKQLTFRDSALGADVEAGLAPPLPKALSDSVVAATATVSERSSSLGGALLEQPIPDVAAGASSAEGRVYWEGFFVVLPVFCGYAALFGLQHSIKAQFGIKDNDSSASHDIGVAFSFLYIFNLIFRVAHNILFGWITPRGRVFLAMSSMMMSMLVIAVMIMILESQNMYWVVLAYAFGGVSIGCFESNFLSCLTPLGHHTKHMAILGIPAGVTTTLVGGFFLMGPPFHVPVTAIYIGVASLISCGMLILAFRIPSGVASDQDGPVKGQIGLRKFISDLKQFRLWLPQIWHYPLAMTIDMFCLSCFSPGVALYIYDQKTVEFGAGVVLQTDSFLAIFNTFNMLGGLLGRYLSYRVKSRHPTVYLYNHAIGVALLLTRIPILAPLSTFFIMMGDGLIYGTISKYIDNNVPREFNLSAISYWLFIGDFGSVTGSNLIAYVRDWVVGS